MRILVCLFILGTYAHAKSFLPESFRSEIKQSYISQIKKKKKESKGVIEYQHPGNLLMKVEGKNRFTLVMNERKSWFYQPPFFEDMKGEVSITDTKKFPLYETLTLLRHGLKTNKFYKVEKRKNTADLTIDNKFHNKFGMKKN